MFTSVPRRHSLATVVLLTALTFLIFYPTLPGEFLRWDDRQNIPFNPWLQHLAWQKIWSEPYYGLYIPVTYSVWSLMNQITSSAWVFHTGNILLHSANAGLVHRLARRLTQQESLAMWSALLFAAHPVQVEAVAWISGGRDLLAAFFALSSTLALLSTPAAFLPLATLLFVLGLLSKPTIAALPLALMIFLRQRREFSSRPRQVTLGIWCTLALALSIWTYWIQSESVALRLQPPDWAERVIVAGDTLGFYLAKILWPAFLCADYGRTPEMVLHSRLFVPTLLVLAGIVTAVWWRSRRKEPGTEFLVVSFLLLLPLLGLIPFQAQADSTVADRYLYLPMTGVALFLALRLQSLPWIACLVVGLLGALSFARSEVWSRNARFFAELYAQNPHSYLATTSLGVEALFRGDLDEAESLLLKARRLRPADAVAVANLAQVYWSKGQFTRILSELAPLLNDSEFSKRNRESTRALSALHRQVARAQWKTGLWEEANSSYCRYHALDPENDEGHKEIQEFLRAKFQAGFHAPSCLSLPADGHYE